MKHTKHPLLLLLMLTLSSLLCAQNSAIEVGTRVGNNATFGNFGALSLVTQHDFADNLALKGGILATTYERFSAEVRPSYHHSTPFGTLHFEALLHYTNQSNMGNFALGGGVGIRTNRLWVTFGYYHRTLQSGGERLAEPFNIYYELGVNCLPSLTDWDLTVALSNSRFMDLERHYLPSLAVDGWWYPSQKMGITLGIHYTPTGVFFISSDYYQLFTNIGVCYKW